MPFPLQGGYASMEELLEVLQHYDVLSRHQEYPELLADSYHASNATWHEGYEVFACRICGNATIRGRGSVARTCGFWTCMVTAQEALSEPSIPFMQPDPDDE